ncbi:glyoxylate reductase [Desulfitispora alkaliphila]|uniref:2-hydroxyacid dehydrogenase n=1 Tax=Desulfitispora alkaliphila TaxID=622674 RepID=UPI003D24BBF9
MGKKRILVTRNIPEEAKKILNDFGDVAYWTREDEPIPREELLKMSEGVDGLYTLLTDRVDEEVLSRSNNLKVVSNMAVGYDNIDVPACTERGVMVTNTPGVLTETTADLTFALMMAVARRIVEASEHLKQGKWKTWVPMELTGMDIHGATLGILGMGRIGEAVAKRAKGFGMNIIYNNRSRKPQVEEMLGVSYVEFEQLLKQSDYVVILTPLTPETKDLIDERELSLMKETAILINVARGSIVNEEALYWALKEKKIWGAGLDVFAKEPVDTKHPLLTLDNFLGLPHIGSASIETRTKMAVIAAQNLVKALKGESPPNLINNPS